MMKVISKRLILIIAVLGLTSNAYPASNKNGASAGKTAVATLATVAGVGLTAVGLGVGAASLGIAETTGTFPLSLVPYALLAIPGIALGLGAPAYLFKSAKGAFAKLRSVLGSTVTLASGAVLLVGFCGLLATAGIKHEVSWMSPIATTDAKIAAHDAYMAGLVVSGVMTLAGGIGTLTGYCIQP